MAADVRDTVTCFLIVASIVLSDGQLMSKEHRTHAASERVNDLWCYQCDTIDDGVDCSDLSANNSSFRHKCKDDRRICMVKKFSYTTSTENSTSSPQMWSMERKCTNKCEPGCIVIGERTKLYACTACCAESYCNTGTGIATELTIKPIEFLLGFLLQATLTIIVYPS